MAEWGYGNPRGSNQHIKLRCDGKQAGSKESHEGSDFKIKQETDSRKKLKTMTNIPFLSITGCRNGPIISVIFK